MGWDFVAGPPHTCVFPSYNDVVVAGAHTGSRWKCDGCKRTYTLTRSDVARTADYELFYSRRD